MERAIRFIMEFYQVSWDTAVLHYWDEVECYMELFGVEE